MTSEFDKFNAAMDTILKANPQTVRIAMDAERASREEEQRRTGKRGRGRPPKRPSASGHASS